MVDNLNTSKPSQPQTTSFQTNGHSSSLNNTPTKTTTNGNNKTDHYSYSYTYKKAADDTGTGIPGVSTVEVNETVTEEIGPDGTKIIRRHQQEKQINKVTQVVTQRVIKRQYIDPTTGTILEYDPNDERFLNLPPETVFEEHTIRSNDDSPIPQVMHKGQKLNVNTNQSSTTSSNTSSPLKRPVKVINGNNGTSTDMVDNRHVINGNLDIFNRHGHSTVVNKYEKQPLIIKNTAHPEDNQGYPEEKNMDYDPDDVNYQDDPQYEGLIPEININDNSDQHSSKNGHGSFPHTSTTTTTTTTSNRTNGHLSNLSLHKSGGSDYVSSASNYADPSGGYTYIGLGGLQQHQQRDDLQSRYSTIQQQHHNDNIYDNGYETHYGSFSPQQFNNMLQQRNFISRHQLIQQQQQQQQLELDGTRSPSLESRIRVEQGWRNPDLEEVIEFLSHPSQEIRSNACAYLQHLCYQDDHTKTLTRQLGGINKLISLILIEGLHGDVYRNACGALRNLSYGRLNDENKIEIKKQGGIQALIRLLKFTQDELTKENITAVLWNLSSCEEIKMGILDEGLQILVTQIIIPYTQLNILNNYNLNYKMGQLNVTNGQNTIQQQKPRMDSNYSIVLTNTTGILRNCSSTLQYSNCDARKKLRDCTGLIDALIRIIDFAIEPFARLTMEQQKFLPEHVQLNLDSKCVENCCCILRNLSFRLQEINDPNYDRDVKLMPFDEYFLNTSINGTNGSKSDGKKFKTKSKKRKSKIEEDFLKNTYPYNMKVPNEGRSQELLWNLSTVNKYLTIIKESTIRDTIEACVGCIQNLTACYWVPSQEVRIEIRKKKGLPTLVCLLQSEKFEDEPIVSVTAIALRNLAIDLKNRELIGKYAMKALIDKLPDPKKPVPLRLNILNEDTITAALACINECVIYSDEFAKSCYNGGGVHRMMFITNHAQSFPPKIVKYAAHVLLSLWKHKNLHDTYKKGGFKEQDFTSTAKHLGIKSHNTSPANTLHRPRGDMGMKLSYNSTISTNKTKQSQPQRPPIQQQFNTLNNKTTNGNHNNNINNNNNNTSIIDSDVPLYSQVQKNQVNRSLIISNGTTNADSWV